MLKKNCLLLYILLVSLTSHAQFTVDQSLKVIKELYFYKCVYGDQLMDFDRLEIYQDTNTPYRNYFKGNFFMSGDFKYILTGSSLSDTYISDFNNNVLSTHHIEVSLGRKPDTIASYLFYKNRMGQDSLIERYGYHNDSSFLVSRDLLFFVNNRISSKISTYSNYNNFNDTSFTYYYFSRDLIDSTISKGNSSSTSSKLIFKYDANDKLIEANLYPPFGEYRYKYNSEGKIKEIELVDFLGSYADATYRFYKTNSFDIDENDNGIQFNVYPSPAIEYLNVSYSDSFKDKPSFRIFDLTGKLMLNGTLESKRISVVNLLPGTYILELQTKDGFPSRQKIIRSSEN